MGVFNYAVSRVSTLPKGGTREDLRAEVVTLKHAFELANTIVTEADTVEVLVKTRDHKGRIDPSILPFVVRANGPRWTAPPQTRGPVAPIFARENAARAELLTANPAEHAYLRSKAEDHVQRKVLDAGYAHARAGTVTGTTRDHADTRKSTTDIMDKFTVARDMRPMKFVDDAPKAGDSSND